MLPAEIPYSPHSRIASALLHLKCAKQFSGREDLEGKAAFFGRSAQQGRQLGALRSRLIMNILIADDDDTTRLLLSSALTKLGHAVHEATNGREAWDAWHGGEFPLIISDWMMPDLDGLEFCRRIRAARRADYTYIVLLTSRSGKTNYLEAMTAGADDFITKPFEKDAFAARVSVAERILALHASLRAANTDLERRVRERTAELGTALHAKDEFLSRASHELRTPMSHVLGFAQLLEMDPLTEEQTESVGQILTSGRHLMTLIDRILQVSHSEPNDLSFLETPATQIREPNQILRESTGAHLLEQI